MTRADLSRLEQALAACTQRVEQLEPAMDTNIRRMAAMQAEIDPSAGIAGATLIPRRWQAMNRNRLRVETIVGDSQD